MKTSITERRSCLVFLAFQQYSSVRPISEEYNWQSFFKKNEMNFEEMLITFNLCSRRFTMTAVICWSIKIKITARNDGPIATIDVHHGLLSNGCINQPRFYKVITIIDKKKFHFIFNNLDYPVVYILTKIWSVLVVISIAQMSVYPNRTKGAFWISMLSKDHQF